MGQCKSTLSAPGRKLLEVMQDLHFGKIENLVISGGEPTFTPAPKITQEIKLGPEGAPRTAPKTENFALKNQVEDLFGHLATLRDGSIVAVEVRHGLPARLVVQREA